MTPALERSARPVAGSLYGRRFQAHAALGSARSARVVVPLVNGLVQPGSVVDVGCGAGSWLAEFRRQGVADELGIDGHAAGVSPELAAGEYLEHDLSTPIPVSRRFDLALSLEVAEHLPPSSGPGFVGELTRLAPAVLFAAAIPHQGGTGHLNERWPDYWAGCFAAHDYAAIDCVRPRVWSNPEVEFWYAQNTLLYAHTSVLARHEGLARAAGLTDPEALAIVHPTLYMAKVEDPDVTFHGMAKVMRTGVRRVSARVNRVVRPEPR